MENQLAHAELACALNCRLKNELRGTPPSMGWQRVGIEEVSLLSLRIAHVRRSHEERQCADRDRMICSHYQPVAPLLRPDLSKEEVFVQALHLGALVLRHGSARLFKQRDAKACKDDDVGFCGEADLHERCLVKPNKAVEKPSRESARVARGLQGERIATTDAPR